VIKIRKNNKKKNLKKNKEKEQPDIFNNKILIKTIKIIRILLNVSDAIRKGI
jgi:hypothetical protein